MAPTLRSATITSVRSEEPLALLSEAAEEFWLPGGRRVLYHALLISADLALAGLLIGSVALGSYYWSVSNADIYDGALPTPSRPTLLALALSVAAVVLGCAGGVLFLILNVPLVLETWHQRAHLREGQLMALARRLWRSRRSSKWLSRFRYTTALILICSPFALLTESDPWLAYLACLAGSVGVLVLAAAYLRGSREQLELAADTRELENALRMLRKRSSSGPDAVAVDSVSAEMPWATAARSVRIFDLDTVVPHWSVVAAAIWFLTMSWAIHEWVVVIGLVFNLSLVVWLLWRARGLVQALPGYELKLDQRQPVLYLREFFADYSLDEDGRYLAEDRLLYGFRESMGPVVALAAPGFPRGSVVLRLFVADEEWQLAVRDLLDCARFVVFGYGSTEAYGWELRTAAKVVGANRVLICLPSPWGADEYRASLYERQRPSIQSAFDAWIPESCLGLDYLMFTADLDTVVFHHDGGVSQHSRSGGSTELNVGDVRSKLVSLLRQKQATPAEALRIARVVATAAQNAAVSHDRQSEQALRRALALRWWVRVRESFVGLVSTSAGWLAVGISLTVAIALAWWMTFAVLFRLLGGLG